MMSVRFVYPSWSFATRGARHSFPLGLRQDFGRSVTDELKMTFFWTFRPLFFPMFYRNKPSSGGGPVNHPLS